MLWPGLSDSGKPEEVLLLSGLSAGGKSGVKGAESGLLLPTAVCGLSRNYKRKQILLPTKYCLLSIMTTFGINSDPLQKEPKIPPGVRIGPFLGRLLKNPPFYNKSRQPPSLRGVY